MADTEPVTLDIADIKRLIPHRYPFLLIDKVVDVVDGTSATGHKNVTVNEPFFQGHFPDKPVMPGVLIVEALAQTAGALVGHSLGLADSGSLVYFMSVDGCKFRKMVVPGDTLALKVEVLRSRRNVWKFSGAAYVGEDLACECEFSAMIAAAEDA